MVRRLIFLISFGVRPIRAMSRSRDNLVIENLALRQQIAALKKERPVLATLHIRRRNQHVAGPMPPREVNGGRP